MPVASWSQTECCISGYHIHVQPHSIILPTKKKTSQKPLALHHQHRTAFLCLVEELPCRPRSSCKKGFHPLLPSATPINHFINIFIGCAAGLQCLDGSNIECLLLYFLGHTKRERWECFPPFLKFNFKTLKESWSLFPLLMTQMGLKSLQDCQDRAGQQPSLRKNESEHSSEGNQRGERSISLK